MHMQQICSVLYFTVVTKTFMLSGREKDVFKGRGVRGGGVKRGEMKHV